MSRESIHRIKCTECPARLTIEHTGVEFVDELAVLLDRLATHLQWDVKARRCPVHRERA